MCIPSSYLTRQSELPNGNRGIDTNMFTDLDVRPLEYASRPRDKVNEGKTGHGRHEPSFSFSLSLFSNLLRIASRDMEAVGLSFLTHAQLIYHHQ